MKFVIDECVEKQIVIHLRREGYEVIYIPEVFPEASDEEVVDLAIKENSILITTDKDFFEHIFRSGSIPGGAILLRLAGISNMNKAELTTSTINKRAKDIMSSFTVISPNSVRIRKTSW